jgi:hypothetical protein
LETQVNFHNFDFIPVQLTTLHVERYKPGVDVMITILYDYRQFFRQKLAFKKNNVIIQILPKLAVF